MTNQPNADALAREFSRILNEWLDQDAIVEINRRNQTPEYADCCATHDFCDPNEAMAQALACFELAFSPQLIDLVNDAWEIASQRHFRP